MAEMVWADKKNRGAGMGLCLWSSNSSCANTTNKSICWRRRQNLCRGIRIRSIYHLSTTGAAITTLTLRQRTRTADPATLAAEPLRCAQIIISRNMRRPTTYEQTLERLKTQGTREQECFSRAATALRAGKGTAAEFSATITDARAAIDKLVQDPELFTSRRAAVAGDATSLMAALGYAPLEGLPGRYEFRTATTPVVLRRLALASKPSRPRCEKSRRAAPRLQRSLAARAGVRRFGDYDPDAALGVDAAAAAPLRGRRRLREGHGVVAGRFRALRRRRGRRASAPAPRAHARGFEANAAGARPLAVGDAQAPRRRRSAAAAAPVEQAQAVGHLQKVIKRSQEARG